MIHFTAFVLFSSLYVMEFQNLCLEASSLFGSSLLAQHMRYPSGFLFQGALKYILFLCISSELTEY